MFILIVGCGSDNGGSEAVRVEGTEYAYVTPGRVEGGVVSMEFANTGEELHEFAMGRLQPGKTLADFRDELTDGEAQLRIHGDLPALLCLSRRGTFFTQTTFHHE